MAHSPAYTILYSHVPPFSFNPDNNERFIYFVVIQCIIMTKLKNIKVVKQFGNSIGITFDGDDKKVWNIKVGSKIQIDDMVVINE